MNRQPPRLAAWLLRRHEALAGDLLERYAEGESDGWFWRQALTAILVNNWPQILFSIAGAPTLWFYGGRFLGFLLSNSVVARTWGLAVGGYAWPEPLVYDQVLRSAVAALMIQPILAVMLLLGRAFRWASLLRTFLISIPLIAATVFLWMVTGIASSTFWVPVILCTLLIAARMGCRATFPDRAARALATVVAALYILHAMSGMGGRWVLDLLNQMLFARSYYVWEVLTWIVPLEAFLIAAACGWTIRRLSSRAIVALLVIWWTLSFGYSTYPYWNSLVTGAIDQPGFRPSLEHFFSRFLAVVIGIVLGGLVHRSSSRSRSVQVETNLDPAG
jgi:hypothetical protein